MSKHTQYISPTMHYTVVIALIISLITTFLLGMLLTETLWGGGLGYFYDYQRNAKIEKQKRIFIDSLNRQIQEQISVSSANAGVIWGAPKFKYEETKNWLDCITRCSDWCYKYTLDQTSEALCRNDCNFECNEQHPR